MARLTAKTAAGYIPEDSAAVVDKLGRFEDFCEKISAEQIELSAQLDALRVTGKSKSARFRELLARKLVNANTIELLRLNGL